MCSTFNRGYGSSILPASTRSPGLAAEDRTLNSGRLVRLQRRALARVVKRIITLCYERRDMGSSPVAGIRACRSTGGFPACTR